MVRDEAEVKIGEQISRLSSPLNIFMQGGGYCRES